MKNILITGGLGFIGFNAVRLWKELRPNYRYFIVDAETYAAKFMLDEKKRWCAENDILTYRYDISKDDDIRFIDNCIINEHNIDTIVNFAAESHVDNSISNPNVFFETNVIGTANMLNLAKKHDIRFHQIGTDEVYGETTPVDWEYSSLDPAWCGRFTATDKLLIPSSPYSSSKASADMIALSYHRTFGTKVTVSRCTNNFGPWQHPEKLIGTTISRILKNEKIPVYGKGNQKRHWIHVDEHNRMIMKILEDGEIGKIYNIAPPEDNWITNMKLIKFILKHLDKSDDLIEHVTDRLGHDTSYFLYGTDFCQSDEDWKEPMRKTIDWYKENL